MFTFCDVFHETNRIRKQTLESAQYGLEIIHKSIMFRSAKVLSIFTALNSSIKNEED